VKGRREKRYLDQLCPINRKRKKEIRIMSEKKSKSYPKSKVYSFAINYNICTIVVENLISTGE
jgi:hypothetical protein